MPTTQRITPAVFQSPLVDSGQVEALHWVFIKKDIVAGVGVGTGSGSLVFDGQVVVMGSTGLLIHGQVAVMVVVVLVVVISCGSSGLVVDH